MVRKRRRAVSVVGLLVAVAVTAVVVALVRDTQAGAADTRACAAGVNLALPAEAGQVRLRVLNGAGAAGVADRVSAEFEARGFVVQPAAVAEQRVAGVAEVRFGPGTVGAAHWIDAHFLGEAEARYDGGRATEVIDIVVGERYRQLATRTEVNQALAQLSAPEPPPGTCAARCGPAGCAPSRPGPGPTSVHLR